MPRKLLAIALIGTLGLLSSCTDTEHIELPVPVSEAAVARGRYLAEGFAACAFCHGSAANPGSPLSGGRVMTDHYGEVKVPNISPHKTGVGTWKSEELFTLMRSGKTKSGRTNQSDLHAGFQWMSDSDTLALVAYLSKQQPVNNTVERRSVSLLKRNTLGITKKSPKNVKGYVPDIEEQNQLQHGKYIVNHVARCGICHDGKSGYFGGRTPLEGGREVKLDVGTKVAPNIRGRDRRGLLRWNENAIVEYLSTGKTPKGSQVDQRYCPVNFYQATTESDREAVAVYLKSLH